MTPEDLVARRKRMGMTQSQMAHELGMTDRTLRRLEKGKSPIHKRTEMAVEKLMQERRLAPQALPGSTGEENDATQT
jgi:transcriptional regulator with XRE-family HTH domain